jgi:AhpD family alkylhydroperoxidase
MQTTSFSKRIYTFPTLRQDLRQIAIGMDDLRAASRSKHISKAFAEKTMLAVTRVNGCRYCSYGHSRAALAAGVPEDELQKIMVGDLGEFPEQEVVALTFAQHYAESGCKPDAAAWQRVVDYYGTETSREILAYIRMITFGNLYGNTFDAFLSRLAWRPAAGSSFLNELGVLLGGLVILPIEMLGQSFKRIFTRNNQSGSN